MCIIKLASQHTHAVLEREREKEWQKRKRMIISRRSPNIISSLSLFGVYLPLHVTVCAWFVFKKKMIKKSHIHTLRSNDQRFPLVCSIEIFLALIEIKTKNDDWRNQISNLSKTKRNSHLSPRASIIEIIVIIGDCLDVCSIGDQVVGPRHLSQTQYRPRHTRKALESSCLIFFERCGLFVCLSHVFRCDISECIVKDYSRRWMRWATSSVKK